MKLFRTFAAAAAVALAACTDRSAAPEHDRQATATRIVGSISRALENGKTTQVCGRPVENQTPQGFLAVTANQCLSCIEVGDLLRQTERDARKSGADVRVVAAADEAVDICEYMRREKVRLPLIAVPRNQWPRAPGVGELIYFVPGEHGGVARLETAATGIELIAKMRGLAEVPSGGAPP